MLPAARGSLFNLLETRLLYHHSVVSNDALIDLSRQEFYHVNSFNTAADQSSSSSSSSWSNNNNFRVYYLCGPTNQVNKKEIELSQFQFRHLSPFDKQLPQQDQADRIRIKSYQLAFINHKDDGTMCFIMHSTHAAAETFISYDSLPYLHLHILAHLS